MAEDVVVGRLTIRPPQFRTARHDAVVEWAPDPRDEDAGIYALVLRLHRPRRVAAGRLGRCRLDAGWYVYVGSAKRNLTARLARHLRREKRPHWHIDGLRAAARVEQIWIWPWGDGRECRTSRRLQALSGASVPWKGFGSSDCRCAAHLTAFADEPRVRRGRRPTPRIPDRGRFAVPPARYLTPGPKGRILASRDIAAQQRSHRDDERRRQG